MTEPSVPALRVVSGSPTPEELAVVTALVAAAAKAREAPLTPGVRRGGWNDRARQQRRALVPGPNAWRSSAW